MRKLSLVCLVLALMAQASPAAGQHYGATDALNFIKTNTDSLVDVIGAAPADYVTITNGYHTSTASSYAFLPLLPLGEHNSISFQFTWATSDTLFYQILCSNSMMDSLTALNQGTATSPIYTVALLKSSFKSGSGALKAAWSPTGSYGPSIEIPGDYGKFYGVRVFTNTQALTALKIVAGASKRVVLGGVE